MKDVITLGAVSSLQSEFPQKKRISPWIGTSIRFQNSISEIRIFGLFVLVWEKTNGNGCLILWC